MVKKKNKLPEDCDLKLQNVYSSRDGNGVIIEHERVTWFFKLLCKKTCLKMINYRFVTWLFNVKIPFTV